MTHGIAPVSVILLAKDSWTAKTRLELSRTDARTVALSLAATTLRTVLEAHHVKQVWVVTSDDAIASDAAQAGARVVAEVLPSGMNRAAMLGRCRALQASPTAPVLVMVADLPHLIPSDVDGLVVEHHERGVPLFVPDHHQEGTTALVHGSDGRPGFAFGRSSALLHARLGYAVANRSARGLRFDLDNPDDLRLATTEGCDLRPRSHVSGGRA